MFVPNHVQQALTYQTETYITQKEGRTLHYNTEEDGCLP